MAEVMVRMAELAVSRSAKDVLVSLGLGSCIGVALLARDGCGAGLAHVVLPSSREANGGERGKFADTAVPALLLELAAIGVARSRLDAILVGGAQMFSLAGAAEAGRLEIGARNERAVREALEAAGIPVAAAATGGSVGRTIRVRLGAGVVVCKEAAGGERVVYGTARRPAPLARMA